MQQRLRAAREYNELRSLLHKSRMIVKWAASLAKTANPEEIKRVVSEVYNDMPQLEETALRAESSPS